MLLDLMVLCIGATAGARREVPTAAQGCSGTLASSSLAVGQLKRNLHTGVPASNIDACMCHANVRKLHPSFTEHIYTYMSIDPNGASCL